MIREIIDTVNEEFDYSFKDVLLGVVHPHDNKGKLIPATSDGVPVPEAIPDTSKTSIVYWEDYGATIWKHTVRYRYVEHEMRLIVWINFKKVDEDYDYCVREILSNLPRKVGNTLLFVSAHLPKSTEVFARYDYQERKQYITYPYDVIALTVRVRYPDMRCPPTKK